MTTSCPRSRPVTTLALGAAALLVASTVLAIPAGRTGGSRTGGTLTPLGTASVAFGMHATVTAAPASDECENNPGPYIRLDGSIVLGGLDARLRFSNNLRGTHEREEDVTTTVELVSDAPIVFNKQPSRGGVGGNPHIWLQLNDCTSGEPTTDYIHLGRCVQGLAMVSLDTVIDAFAHAQVTTGDCTNSGGPNITLAGELSLGGICGTLVFTNNEAFTHVHEEDVTAELVIIPAGQKIVFAKQPPQGGVGGNPHIFLQFLNGDGSPIGTEFYLGRCNKLGG
jgi:hypothetical protein